MPSNGRPRVRRLKRNHGCETPGSLLFLDCESTEEVVRERPRKVILRFRLACLTYVRYEKGEISRRDTLDSLDWIEVWDWIESKQSKSRPLWVYGHNLGFDLTMLHFWEQAQLGAYRVGSTSPEESNGILSGTRKYRGRLCVDGFPFFVYCLGKRGVCKFVDSLNYYPMTLEKLGERLGFPKMPWPGFAATDETMLSYCRRDVDIVEKAITKTLDCWRESDGGVWQPTAAMLSLTSFRHKLGAPRSNGTESHILYDDKDEWTVMERDAYYGGQVTCWYVGPIVPRDLDVDDFRVVKDIYEESRPQGPLYLLDVRSLYPSVMRDAKFPFRRFRRMRHTTPQELLATMRAYGAIARVLLESPDEEYTLRTEKGQLQAVGRFETTLAGPELERALRSGHVVKVIDAQTYCLDTLFRTWVDDWMRVREEADQVGDVMRAEYAKLILNSLSGKFAQTGKHWTERPGTTPPCDYGRWNELDADTGDVRRFRSVCGATQEEIQGDPPWYTFPSISAYVTALGREHMRWLRQQCPPRSVLYQATDSLLVTDEGYFALQGLGLIKPRELGYLQLRETAEYGEVLGCNHYRVGEKWVRSGSWGKAVKQDDGQYVYQSFQGTTSILETQPDGSVTVDWVSLRKIGEYPKGRVDVTGWVSWPKLGEEQVPF